MCIGKSGLRFLVCFITLFHLQHCESQLINDVFHTFQPVYFDRDLLLSQHVIVRRSTHLTVKTTLHTAQRTYDMVLRPDDSVFSDYAQVEVGSDPYTIDKGKTYTGYIEGERSRVFGIITWSGHFHGQIRTDNDTLYVEPTHHYLSSSLPYHSIMYRLADVKYDFHRSPCMAEELKKKLQTRYHDIQSNDKIYDNMQTNGQKKDYKYSYKAQEDHDRRKRSVDPTKTVCELYMQADHLFYQRYDSNADTVIEQLSSYVQAVNNIFQPIDFDDDSSSDNIRFIVKRLKIFTDPNAAGYKFPSHYSVEKFLDIHSETNYNDFCLSYMFTDRDFDGGVLGLAWVASLSSSGGVCETFKTYSGNEQKSLNTGIVTVKNYGKSVASVVTQVTFAHELGHNFGSDHDKDGTSCAPGGDQGNFIMYSKATSGYLSNNDEFSTCSVEQISPIIANKARSSSGCFTVHTGKICGNKIVEGDEECDCGWDDECSESCCVPQSSGASNPCTFNNPSNTPNFCSPSQGPCCKSNCQYRQSSESFTCRQNTTCMDKAVCDNGSGFSCPDSSPKSNGTSCNDGQVCYLGVYVGYTVGNAVIPSGLVPDGITYVSNSISNIYLSEPQNTECSASVCLANGYQSCQCPGNGFSDANLCKLCCVDGNGSCKFASELSGITETNAFPGSPCNDFQGYCDVFYVCREVDPSGPLNNIRKLLLSGEVIESVKTFLTEHWYVGIAAGVGLIIILAVIVKVCSKSHGPKARSSSLEVLSKNNRVGPRETHM